MWETLTREFRQALLVLKRNPGFSIAVILTLALGIACNAIVFSAVNAVILRPLPYNNPDELVTIWNRYGKTEPSRSHNSVPDYYDRVEQSKTLKSISAFRPASFDYTGEAEPQKLQGTLVTASFFAVLEVAPLLGRYPAADEDAPGRNQVAVISHRFWQRQFASDPKILGRSLQLNGLPYEVIGVLPRSFRFPHPDVDIWAPIAFSSDQRGNSERGNESLQIIARRKHGVSVEQTSAEMEMIAARVPEIAPERRNFLINSGWGSMVIPLSEFFSAEIRPALVALMGAVIFLLLVVCSNVAHLMLVHLAGRRKDVAIRSALGANSWQLFRGHFLQSLILTLAGACAGLLFAHWSLAALKGLLPMDLSHFGETSVDLYVIAFVAVLSLTVAALLSGLSARDFFRRDLQATVRESAAGLSQGSASHYALIGAEIALSLLLVTSATLLMKSFLEIHRQSPGFATADRFTFTISLPRTRYPERPQRADFYSRLMQSLRQIPHVNEVGATGCLPLAEENWTATFVVEGFRPGPGTPNPGFEYRPVTPGYFPAMGIPILRGRDFSDRDTRESALVAIIDQQLAARFWPGDNPLGKRLGFSNPQNKIEWREVVGVVGTVRNTSVLTPSQEQVYFPHAQMAVSNLFVVVHTAPDATGVLSAVRSRLAEMDPALPLDRIRNMDQVLADSVARPRFQTSMLGLFAAISMLLAIVGIYGVTAYTVRKQTREIGIRMALGATQSAITAQVVTRGLKAALLGILLGTAGSIATARILASFLYRVRANDPSVLAGAAVLMLAMAVAASYIPARRAARIDPLVALRYE